MTYADYAFYRDSYFGTVIEEADFPRLALRASSFLDYYTQGRAVENADLEALKMACCAVAEKQMLIEQSQALSAKSLSAGLESAAGELQSQTVGPWTKSYRSGGESAVSAETAAGAFRASLADAARQYLAHTGLLYRGRRCCL